MTVALPQVCPEVFGSAWSHVTCKKKGLITPILGQRPQKVRQPDQEGIILCPLW